MWAESKRQFKRNTGYFKEPYSDLSNILDLKTSVKEAYLPGVYGCTCVFYLYKDKELVNYAT